MPRPAIPECILATLKAADERRDAEHAEIARLRMLDQEQAIVREMREIDRQAVDVLYALTDADGEDDPALTAVCGWSRLTSLRGRWHGLHADLRMLHWYVKRDRRAVARGWTLASEIPAVPWAFDHVEDASAALTAEVDRLIAALSGTR